MRETSRKKWMTAACLMLLLTLLPATGLAEDELRIQESWSLALIQGGRHSSDGRAGAAMAEMGERFFAPDAEMQIVG